MKIRSISENERCIIDDIVSIHLLTFQGFFLTFMGKGFLTLMYRSYVEFEGSGILAAFNGQQVLGFVAYSGKLSGLYKYMLRKRLLPFMWYGVQALMRKPSIFLRLVRALLKPSESKREEKYVEIASIGVEPSTKAKGVGTQLIDALKARVDGHSYEYISLETDAIDNEGANHFYLKNGFTLERSFITNEGRKMNEYRFYLVAGGNAT